jgi:hypothetical protein
MSTSALNQSNGRLKRDHVPVSLYVKRDRLYLQATLPPAPNSGKLIWHQQRIALRLTLTTANVSISEKRARQLGAELAIGEFDWKNWRRSAPTPGAQIRSCGELVEAMRLDYFQRRAETPKTRRTWKDYEQVLRLLPPGQPFSSHLALDLALRFAPDTKSRQRACLVLGMLAKFSGVDLDLSAYRGDYGKSRLKIRSIPSDQLVIETRELFKNESWRWAYGMIVVYGLRSHELFDCLMNDDGTLTVFEEGKTASRTIAPCPPTLVDEWLLRSESLPQVSGSDNTALGSRVGHAFARAKAPFPPSVLRHCWAIRSLGFFPYELAALMMGHSPQVHHDTYLHWINERQIKDAVLLRASDGRLDSDLKANLSPHLKEP